MNIRDTLPPAPRPSPECAACAAPGALPAPEALPEHRGEHLCGPCAERAALTAGALGHLAAALGPVLAEWSARWRAAGLDLDGRAAVLELVAFEWRRAARPRAVLAELEPPEAAPAA